MANEDSIEKTSSPTLREVADKTVEKWEALYRENPDFYVGYIVEAIKYSIRDQVIDAASQVLAEKHRPNINRLMELAIKDWLARGIVTLQNPSARTLKKINDVLSVLANDALYATEGAAEQLKIAAYKLHAAGVKPEQIANRLGMSTSSASQLVARACKDIEKSKSLLSLYRVRRSKKKR